MLDPNDSQLSFGLLLAGQFPSSWSPHDAVQATIEQVRLAREAGFDAVWASQHFVADFQFLQPLPLLARIAAVSGDMRIGSCVILVPFYPPVLLAEEVATLDAITGGRFIFGAGTGYRRSGFTAFGMPPSERAGRFEEGLAVLRALWTGESASFDGRYTQVPEAKLQLLPPQGPRLPVWIGATGPQGIRRAARLGDEWIATPELSITGMKNRQDLYRESADDEYIEKIFPLTRESFAASSRLEALRIAEPSLRVKYEAYARWGHTQADLSSMLDESFILGSGEDCVEQIERYVAETRTRHIALRMQWPGLDHESVLESIATYGEGIIPHFRAATCG